MIITQLEYLEDGKVKVYINDEYAFLLYQSDIRKHGLVENKELGEELYTEILEHTVFRRAKQKAMLILKYANRTEKELRDKLLGADYNTDIVERTIEYMKSFHYIDDYNYVSNYIHANHTKKSKKQIIQQLYFKGIGKDLVEEVWEEEEKDDLEAIRKAIKKKIGQKNDLTQLERQKLIASLYRKGFNVEDIYKCMD